MECQDPHLVVLESEDSAAGVVIYHLPADQTTTIGSGKANDISIQVTADPRVTMLSILFVLQCHPFGVDTIDF